MPGGYLPDEQRRRADDGSLSGRGPQAGSGRRCLPSSRHLTTAVEQLAQAAGIDVGGIEFLRSARDGQLYFYDINALSNFVSGPEQLLGFDPTERLVDALVQWLPSLAPAAPGGRA